jgi:hypothetical protein
VGSGRREDCRADAYWSGRALLVRRVRFVRRGAACGCGLSRVGGRARCGVASPGNPGAARPWMWPVMSLACERSAVGAGRVAWDVGVGCGLRAGRWLTNFGSGGYVAKRLCRVWPSSPMLGRSPTAGAAGSKRRWRRQSPHRLAA